MTQVFMSYWWLLFPLAAFVFGAFDRWLAYKRSRDQIELIKTYAAQGKEPPPELLAAARAEAEAPLYMHPRAARRYYRGYYRWGPGAGWGPWGAYGHWRGAIFTGAVAAGFWVASESSVLPGTEAPFRLVAIVLTCVAVANLVVAVIGAAFRPHDDDFNANPPK